MIKTYILSLFCILLLAVLAHIHVIDSTAQIPYPWEDLTGKWKGQDQGIYYVRQIGNDIMWMGLSPDEGKTWTNVFVGKINGDIISGKWADMPRGKIVQGVGTLTLKVSPIKPSTETGFYDKIVIQKIGSTGSPFGTSTWVMYQCSFAQLFSGCR